MKREVREVKEGVVQITTLDERWYVKTVKDGEGIPKILYVPSVTWIAEHYPKGIGYYKWLANKGWDEAEAIKIAAGDKGSKVHQAIARLLEGDTVPMEAEFQNKTTENPEELSVEEYECLMSFVDWHNAVKPITIASEITVFNEKHNYAGTIDWIGLIKDEVYILDFKTSAYIWPSHEIQISAYSNAVINRPIKDWNKRKLAILQLGYKRNKNGYKFTDIKDKFDLFLAAKQIWQHECENIKPKQKDYPKELKLEKGDF